MREEVRVIKMHQFLDGRRGRADSQLAGMPVYSSAARTPDFGDSDMDNLERIGIRKQYFSTATMEQIQPYMMLT